MADVVRYPEPHCLRCWSDNCDRGVLDGGAVIGPYCLDCAEMMASDRNNAASKKQSIQEALEDLARDGMNLVAAYLRKLTDEQLLEAEVIMSGAKPTNCGWPLYEIRETVLDMVLNAQEPRGIRTRFGPNVTVHKRTN